MFSTTNKPQTPAFGSVLGDAIRFKQVEVSLTDHLQKGSPETVICEELGITPEQLKKFRPKIHLKKKPIQTTPQKPVEVNKLVSRGVSFREFIAMTEGDIYLIPWASYRRVLEPVHDELLATLHHLDPRVDSKEIPNYHEESRYREVSPAGMWVGSGGRGWFIQYEDLVRLLRLSLEKKYPRDVTDFIKENKLKVFKCIITHVDSTTLFIPKVCNRKINSIDIRVLDTQFDNIIKHRTDNDSELIKEYLTTHEVRRIEPEISHRQKMKQITSKIDEVFR